MPTCYFVKLFRNVLHLPPPEAGFANYQQSATKLKNIISISNGQTLRVRGLLLLDGTHYRMVAIHVLM